MAKYTEAELELIRFDAEDVITTSTDTKIIIDDEE